MTELEGDLEELTMYLAESREHLATIEADLLAIEAGGANIDETLVNKVFRAAHSIKGGAGFFGLKTIQELAHKVENTLDLVRSHTMIPNPEIINILLLAFDRLRELINNHRESNQIDISEHVVSLSGLATSYLPAAQISLSQKMRAITSPSGGAPLQVSEYDLERAKEREEYVYLVEIDLIHDIHRRGKKPWDVLKDYLSGGEILESQFNLEAVGTLDDEPSMRIPLDLLFTTVIDPSFIGSLFTDIPQERIALVQGPLHPQALLVSRPVQPENALAAAPEPHVEPETAHPETVQAAASAEHGQPAAGEETLRVNVGLLENLMNLAGELVLSRNQLQEAIQRGDARTLHASGQRISLVTSELQETIMLTRMQPIGNILNKFPRVVRDLAQARKKDIRLEIYGREVELDKTLIEGLSDPLTHMVRNAVDHGIEPQSQRAALGKHPTGKVTLRAYHAAGQVVLEVSDDGQGIDPQKVLQSALRKGLVSEEQALSMSEKDKLALIFLPGLSTAEQVTDVSGRGVGMDVVKTNLDRLGGKVEIESQIGKGTTFRITLPLTLAIIPSLLVSVGGERFAIPQINVSELIHVAADQAKNRVEVVGNAEVLVLRGKLVPVVRLADLLGIQPTYIDLESGRLKASRRVRLSDRRSRRSKLKSQETAPTFEHSGADDRRRQSDRRFHASSGLNIVVVSAGTFEYGLVVEELHDTIEIVVRPLGRHLKECREYAGATILGDGRVAVILDAAGLAAKAELTSLAGSARAQELERAAAHIEQDSLQTLLIFRNAPDEPCAMPLNLVERIEHIERRQVEVLGGRRAMQYRGASLPLVTLKDTAQVGELGETAERVVIVTNVAGRQIGLLAAMPVDVVETQIRLDTQTHRQPGIAGSSIVVGQTTLLLDIRELVEEAGLVESRLDAGAPGGLSLPPAGLLSQGSKFVLVAEDSDFFRSQVRRYLESDGYQVLAAEDGQAAWELLHRYAGQVELVVTDIEMPRLSGLELTRLIRANPELAGLPVIALTSLADEADIEAGKAAGVSAYEIKLDKENLLAKTHLLLSQEQPV